MPTLPPRAPSAFVLPPTCAVRLDSAELCSRVLGAPVRPEDCQSPAVCGGPPGSPAQGAGQGGVSPPRQPASHAPALVTKEQTGVMAWWQPWVPFNRPEGCMGGKTSRGLSLRLSARCHVAKAGSRHLSHSDPESVKDQMTSFDTGEQLTGLSTKLSRSRDAHLSSCHSQKYTQCIINKLFRSILWGLYRVYFRQYSIIINCLLRRTVSPPLYKKGLESQQGKSWGRTWVESPCLAHRRCSLKIC